MQYIVVHARQEGERRASGGFGFAHCAFRLDSWPVLQSVSLRIVLKESMKSLVVVTAVAASLLSVFVLSGCVDDQAAHHRAPPKDPQDYHGVPTDDRPPSMLGAPDAPK